MWNYSRCKINRVIDIRSLWVPKVLPALDVDGGTRPFPPLVNHSLVRYSFPKVLACLLRWWWWWWLILNQSLRNLSWGCENVNKWINSSMWNVFSSHVFIKDICLLVVDFVTEFVTLSYLCIFSKALQQHHQSCWCHLSLIPNAPWDHNVVSSSRVVFPYH